MRPLIQVFELTEFLRRVKDLPGPGDDHVASFALDFETIKYRPYLTLRMWVSLKESDVAFVRFIESERGDTVPALLGMLATAQLAISRGGRFMVYKPASQCPGAELSRAVSS